MQDIISISTSPSASPSPRARQLRFAVALYILIAFGFSWTVQVVGPVPLSMCGPAVAALVVQKFYLRAPVRLGLGLQWGRLRRWWEAPVVAVAVVLIPTAASVLLFPETLRTPANILAAKQLRMFGTGPV